MAPRRQLFIGIGGLLGLLALWVGYALVQAMRQYAIAVDDLIPTGDSSPGTLVSAESVGEFSRLMLQLLIARANSPYPIPNSHAIHLYRLRYWTTYPDGRAVIASGLVALPKDSASHGTVVYLHGTNTYRPASPSAPSLVEGIPVSAVFAGGGYTLVAPDYIGLGTSTEPHPYLHTEATVNATLDLLTSAQTFIDGKTAIGWNPSLYIVGFSQGGHSAVAVHRALEQANRPAWNVVADAAIAGPYNMSDVGIPYAFEGHSGGSSLYLAYMAYAYSNAYGYPLDQLLLPQYAALVPTLYTGATTLAAVMAALPADPKAMFLPSVVTDFNAKRGWFYERAAENNVYDWVPRAPVRLYYGELDVDVTPENSRFTLAWMAERNITTVEGVSVGQQDHSGTLLHAIGQVRAWFDALSLTTVTRKGSKDSNEYFSNE
jgi:pimeloyl-ACP methyl ester carboxylesterase